MASKTELSSLILNWGSPYYNEKTRNDDEVLQGLKPYNNITHLFISGYAGSEFALWMKDTFVTRNLRTLKLVDCINCTLLPPIWQLPSLENLELKDMSSLVYICNTGSSEVQNNEHVTIFQNLKKLEIRYSDNLEGWHNKADKLVIFPKLEEMRIDYSPKLKSVSFSTPLLRQFNTYNPGGIKLLQISNMTMGVSSELYITLRPSHTEPDTFRPPKNVVKMEVDGLENVIPVEEDNEENYKNVALRQLTISSSNCFFSCGTSQLSLGFWKYFAFLETLCISRCSALSLWPEEEFRSLIYLKELEIEGCKNFTCSSKELLLPKTYGELLPGLEKLCISNCPKLVKIPNCFKSLEVLKVYGCPSLSKEGLGLVKNLYELKELSVGHIKDLKSLPDGLEYLTSLERLSIFQCPAMESFPEGIQQRLPALQHLRIIGCPVLERRCRNGEYRHLVLAIPGKWFTPD